MRLRASLAAVCAGLVAWLAPMAAAQVVRYDGDRVVRVKASTVRELRTALALTDDPWTCGSPALGEFDMRVSQEQAAALADAGVPFDVMIDDLQALVDAERDRLAGQGGRDADWYTDFKPLADINARIDELVAAHAGVAKVEPVGTSFQGRAIRAVHISGAGGFGTKPVLFFIGTQHAREWISPMTVMYIVENLMSGYGVDARVTAILDEVEFVIVPVVNPDGYDYTWTTERFWRKNRRPPPTGSGCWGVDLNRNWGHQWGGSGSSSDPCSETYRGTAAWSEPETTAVRDYLAAIGCRAEAFIDFHSYGQLVLWPWSYTTAPPPDASRLSGVSELIRQAILATPGGLNYTQGQGAATLYLAAGASKDWPYAQYGALSWTIELRGGSGGFAPPPTEILPCATENFSGVLALAEEVIANPSGSLTLTIPSGAPEVLEPDEPTEFTVSIASCGESLEPGSAKLFARLGTTGAFAATALTALGGDLFTAELAGGPCGDTVQFYVEAKSIAGDTYTLPEDGAAAPFEGVYRVATQVYADTMEAASGWELSVPTDNATTGRWNRMDPQATSAQPGDDVTPFPGVNCMVTDGTAGSGVGSFDIDNGTTTLTSPAFDGTGGWDINFGDPQISYHRWYSNNQGANPNTNSMPVQVSRDGGATWTQVELVTENAGAWVLKSVRPSDAGVAPSESMKIRFVARDLTGAIVEAAVDDVTVSVLGCARHPADFNKDGDLNFFDFIAFQDLFSVEDPRADLDQSTGVGVFDFFDFVVFQDLFNG